MHSEPEQAARRTGPRPIGPHLTTASGILLSSLGALPMLRSGLLPLHPSLAAEGQALAAALAAADPVRPQLDLTHLVQRTWADFQQGVRTYQAHPYRRALTAPPAIWQEGGSTLHPYGGDGPAMLFVPSLVNRAYVLDLSAQRSFLRWLAGQGVQPFLLDWGTPGEVEAEFDLNAYVARLGRAIDILADAHGPIGLGGYCMGGNLALAGALSRADKVKALALLATPWDFHADGALGTQVFAQAQNAVRASLMAGGQLDVDALQLFFLALDPALGLRKFSAFARLSPDSQAAQDFVALEDWLNDGVPLVRRVAEECLVGWYGENRSAADGWLRDGQPIRPEDWIGPALAVIPANDRIVPPAGALALADRLGGPKLVLRPPLGHIGMMVGSRAQAGVWEPLAAWCSATLAAPRARKRRPKGEVQ